MHGLGAFFIQNFILTRETRMKPVETQKYVGAVESAVTILRHLASMGLPDGVASIARATELNVSTTFNILKTLVKEGLATFDPEAKTYAIAMGVLEFSAPLLGRTQMALIRPLLIQIAEERRVLVALWLVTPQGRIVLSDRVVPRNIVRADMEPGARLPALVGAIGRCIAARTGMTREQLRPAFAALRWQNPPEFDAYWADVEVARTRGYAFDMGNLFSGLNIAAAVACDHEGTPRFGLSAITISGQMDDAGLELAARDLSGAAALIERNIFGRPPA
ncbi:MAG: DNA-binding IclR family transcriptional regulator [Paracoccaceae bacterium]